MWPWSKQPSKQQELLDEAIALVSKGDMDAADETVLVQLKGSFFVIAASLTDYKKALLEAKRLLGERKDNRIKVLNQLNEAKRKLEIAVGLFEDLH